MLHKLRCEGAELTLEKCSVIRRAWATLAAHIGLHQELEFLACLCAELILRNDTNADVGAGARRWVNDERSGYRIKAEPSG